MHTFFTIGPMGEILWGSFYLRRRKKIIELEQKLECAMI